MPTALRGHDADLHAHARPWAWHPALRRRANGLTYLMRTLKLTLAYDGTDFCGWQFQPGRRTVQQTVQDTLAKVTDETSCVTASGRTDAGVHALAQAAAFVTASQLPLDVMQRALNAELPNDVRVLDVTEVAAGFDPIRDVQRK